MSNTRLMTIIGIVVFAAASRLLPHLPNISPIAAVALFGGAMLSGRRTAFVIPLAAMFLSDLFLGFHRQLPVVYLCFLATVAMGRLLAERRSPLSVAAAALASSLLFFVVTNFSVWAFDGLYPQTLAGFTTCFVAALPFFQHSLVGDLSYTIALFGGFSLLTRWIPALREPLLA